MTSTREFTNEFGHKIKIFVREMVDNHIKITMEGPNSISESIVTPREFDQLRSALLDYNMTSNLTRTDLMDSDYARDVMHVVPAKVTAIYSSGNCAAHEETVEVEYPEFTYISKRPRWAGDLRYGDDRAEVAKKGEPVQPARDLEAVRSFAASFHFTVTDSFYNDCYLHIHEPDSVSFRLGNGSQFSKHVAKLEARRKAALASSAVAVTEEMVTAARKAADDALWKWRGLGERKDGEGLDGMHFIVRDALIAALATPAQAAAWQWRTTDTWHTAEIDKFEDAERYARTMAGEFGQVRTIYALAMPDGAGRDI